MDAEITGRIEKLNRALLAAFLAVSLMLAYWSVVRADRILPRDDNPRLVEAELRIARGRILDTNEVVLAESVTSGARYERVYPFSDIGPAVGYYSLRYGTAGIEEGYDGLLRGDSAEFWTNWRRDTLHEVQRGRDVRLTLDARWQQAAEAALGDRDGAVILLSLPDAAVRALVSHPTYDPNTLDAAFEQLAADERAPLFNRATQGLFQPGLVLQPFIIATALDAGVVTLDAPVNVGQPALLDEFELGCIRPISGAPTWADALAAGCAAPLVQLAGQFSTDDWLAAWRAWGFTTEPSLPIATDAGEIESISDVRRAAIGQENLTVTPLQVALAWTALAQADALPTPQLVAAVQQADGSWQSQRQPSSSVSPTQPVSNASARAVLDVLLTQNGGGFSALAVAGPGGERLGWYIGLAPANAPRFAVVVVVEDAQDVAAVEEIGRTILRTVTAGQP